MLVGADGDPLRLATFCNVFFDVRGSDFKPWLSRLADGLFGNLEDFGLALPFGCEGSLFSSESTSLLRLVRGEWLIEGRAMLESTSLRSPLSLRLLSWIVCDFSFC
jgi:hypothetical protein